MEKEVLKSKEEFSKNKINEVSSKALKVINVFRSICHVLMIITIVVSLGMLIIAVTNTLTNWLEDWFINRPNILNKINVSDENTYGFIDIVDKIPLQELINNGKFDHLLYGMAADVFAGFINVLIVYFLLLIFKNFFIKLEQVESPFDEKLIVDVKRTFIIISIMVLINEFFVGIIVSLVLVCFYNLYKYGCKLQKESDETI